jgi:hypothetical protein
VQILCLVGFTQQSLNCRQYATKKLALQPHLPTLLLPAGTSSHLLADSNFTEAFWNNIAPLYNIPSYASISSAGLGVMAI